jgi:hypothetical protein
MTTIITVATKRRIHKDNDNNSSDKEEDPQMARLLHRLQQEYNTDFGGLGPNWLDAARARYLVESSAGNIGLASMMYWEDYLANNHHNPNHDINNNEQQQQQEQQFASPRGGGGEGSLIYIS